MPQVFISYPRSRIETAKAIRHSLQRSGVSASLDVDFLKEGQDWESEINAAIEKAKSLLVLVDSAALTSAQVGRENELAQKLGKRILALELEPLPTELPSWATDLRRKTNFARYDPLDERVTTGRLIRGLQVSASPFRIHNNRFWVSLSALLAVPLGALLIIRTGGIPVDVECKPPTRLAQKDLSGCWKVWQVHDSGIRDTGTLVLNQSRKELTGEIRWDDARRARLASGKVDTDLTSLSFRTEFFGSTGLEGWYEGKISTNFRQLSGETRSNRGGHAMWTAIPSEP